MIYYKYFTTRWLDPINDYDQLKAEFPQCSFIKGRHKDAAGIYVVNDLHNKVYGEKIQLDNGDIFWGPANPQEAIKQLNDHLTNWEERIKVTLKVGIDLHIFPATAVPKKIFLNRNIVEDNCPFNLTDEYGKQGFKVAQICDNKEEVTLGDERVLTLIKLGLQRSYNLPIDVWDCLGIISSGDIEILLASCLGFNEEFLKKTYEESKEQ